MRVLYLCDGHGQRLTLGTFAGPFDAALREAVERYGGSLRRLACAAWAIEGDRGEWAELSQVFPRKRPRDAPGLFDDELPRRAARGNKKAPGLGAL